MRIKLLGCDYLNTRNHGILGAITAKKLIFVADILRDTQVWSQKAAERAVTT